MGEERRTGMNEILAELKESNRRLAEIEKNQAVLSADVSHIKTKADDTSKNLGIVVDTINGTNSSKGLKERIGTLETGWGLAKWAAATSVGAAISCLVLAVWNFIRGHS